MVDSLKQKIKNQNEQCKDLEKKFNKDKSMGLNDFISNYMKARMDYHKF